MKEKPQWDWEEEGEAESGGEKGREREEDRERKVVVLLGHNTKTFPATCVVMASRQCR